jgi:hypothetical protein
MYSDYAVGFTTGVSISGKAEIFLFATASRPTLGSTQPPMQLVPGIFILE